MIIKVFGDLQQGDKGFDEEAWEQFEDEGKSEKNVVYLGLGDYMDAFRPTIRGRLLPAMDDSSRKHFEGMYLKEHDKMIKRLSFMEGKLIGIHNGHHCMEFLNGTNSDQRLASALKAPYLGWIASTRVCLKRKGSNTSLTHMIVSMHGQANARGTGGAVNWVENNFVGSWIVDHVIMGHNCKSAAWEPQIYHIPNREGPPGWKEKIPYCLNVGGFSKSYTNGWETSWVERMGFVPQALGWGVIRLKIKHNGKKEKEQDWIDVESLNRHPRPK